MLAWLASMAWADECSCVTWDDAFEWSDCAGGDCACGCADEIAHDGGTTSTAAEGTVCADPTDPRTDADCVLVASTCVEADCCDELVADCPGEAPDGGCGCDQGGAGAGPAAWLLVALARRRGSTCS